MSAYDDIIRLERPRSDKHHPMPRLSRAAQFAPFAALTGYEDAVRETARLTSKRRELSDEEKRILDDKISILEASGAVSGVELTYFVPDKKKDGGEYVTECIDVHRVDRVMGTVVLKNKKNIKLSDIDDIKWEMFNNIIFD